MKKNKNAFLNLTPYIDVFITLLGFFLLTAVWAPVQYISSSAVMMDHPANFQVKNNETNGPKLEINLFNDHIELQASDEPVIKVSHISENLNIIDVQKELKLWRSRFPDKNDIVIRTDDNSKYKHLISVLDLLRQLEFSDVGIHTL